MAPAQWFFKRGNGQWAAYSQDDNADLERAYASRFVCGGERVENAQLATATVCALTHP